MHRDLIIKSFTTINVSSYTLSQITNQQIQCYGWKHIRSINKREIALQGGANLNVADAQKDKWYSSNNSES